MLPVGSIVASFLTEEDFKHEMKTIAHEQVWALAGGQTIPSGRFQELIRNNQVYSALNPGNVATAPDLRGAFLRGLNGSRPNDNRGDPDGHNRQLGSYQQDAFASHDHAICPTYPNKPNAPDQDAGRRTLGSIGWDGYPESRTQTKGEAETRPRNFAVNYFVRLA